MRTSNKDRKTATLSIRTSVDLRSKLQTSLEESGRSLTQEVEMRLEKSFQSDDFVGGDRNAAFLNVLGAGMREIELTTGQSWLSDVETWQKVAELVSELIYDREPKEPTRPALLPRNDRTKPKRLPMFGSSDGDQV